MKKKSVSTLRDVQAGFWKRLIAYIIDVVVMMIVVVKNNTYWNWKGEE